MNHKIINCNKKNKTKKNVQGVALRDFALVSSRLNVLMVIQ